MLACRVWIAVLCFGLLLTANRAMSPISFSSRPGIIYDQRVGGPFTAFTVADLTGDALPELIVVRNGAVYTFAASSNAGETVFSNTPLLLLSVGGSPSFLETVDLDRDGDLDLVLGPTSNGSIVWLENPQGEAGGFWISHALISAAFPLTSIAPRASLADLDGDDRLDIVYGYQLPKDAFGDFRVVFRVARQLPVLPSVTMSVPETITYHESCSLPSIRLSDLDHDGKPDFIFAFNQLLGARTQTVTIVCRNKSSASALGWDPPISLPEYVRFDRAIDFDSDGDLDFVEHIKEIDSYAMLENTSWPGTLQFSTRYFIDANWSIAPLDAADAVDLDRDGYADFVTRISAGDSSNSAFPVFFRRNLFSELNYGALFTHPIELINVIYGDPIDHMHCLFIDVDADGDLDLLTFQPGRCVITGWRNTTSQLWASFHIKVLGPVRPGDWLMVHWVADLRTVGSAVFLELWRDNEKVADLGSSYSPVAGRVERVTIPSVPEGTYRVVVRSSYDASLSVSAGSFELRAESQIAPSDWLNY